jgi:hypothetical protein
MKVIEAQKKVRRGSKQPVICWAHSKTGERCTNRVKSAEGEGDNPIPYCGIHRRVGDQALRVVPHPNKDWGKLLVARFPLPRGYKMVSTDSYYRADPSSQILLTVFFL